MISIKMRCRSCSSDRLADVSGGSASNAGGGRSVELWSKEESWAKCNAGEAKNWKRGQHAGDGAGVRGAEEKEGEAADKEQACSLVRGSQSGSRACSLSRQVRPLRQVHLLRLPLQGTMKGKKKEERKEKLSTNV